MEMKPGARLRSAACGAEVVVVRAPAGAVDLCFGGHPALPATAPAGDLEPLPDRAGELRMGARYTDAETGVEVLVTKPGTSLLSIGDRLLERRDPKALPASD